MLNVAGLREIDQRNKLNRQKNAAVYGLNAAEYGKAADELLREVERTLPPVAISSPPMSNGGLMIDFGYGIPERGDKRAKNPLRIKQAPAISLSPYGSQKTVVPEISGGSMEKLGFHDPAMLRAQNKQPIEIDPWALDVFLENPIKDPNSTENLNSRKEYVSPGVLVNHNLAATVTPSKEQGDTVGAFLAGFGQGLTGTLSDKILAGLYTPFNGKGYGENLAEGQAKLAELMRSNSVAYNIGDWTGIAVPVVTGIGLSGLAVKGAGRLGAKLISQELIKRLLKQGAGSKLLEQLLKQKGGLKLLERLLKQAGGSKLLGAVRGGAHDKYWRR